MESSTKNKSNRSIIGAIFGGKLLEQEFITKNSKFFLYLFGLAILYITLNFSFENVMIESRRNEKELKNLRADYNSKSAKLLYRSKKTEIEKILNKHNSKVKRPNSPAKRIIMD